MHQTKPEILSEKIVNEKGKGGKRRQRAKSKRWLGPFRSTGDRSKRTSAMLMLPAGKLAFKAQKKKKKVLKKAKKES